MLVLPRRGTEEVGLQLHHLAARGGSEEAALSAWIWLACGCRAVAEDVDLGIAVVDSAGRDWICAEGPFGRRVWVEPARVK